MHTVLGERVRSLRREDAVDLPRFVTVAAGDRAVHVFGYRKTEAYMIRQHRPRIGSTSTCSNASSGRG